MSVQFNARRMDTAAATAAALAPDPNIPGLDGGSAAASETSSSLSLIPKSIPSAPAAIETAYSVRDLFFSCHLPQLKELVFSSAPLNQRVSGIIASYLVVSKPEENPTLREDWIKEGVDPGNVSVDMDYYKFWHGQDAVHPELQNCETHEPPVVASGSFVDITTKNEVPRNFQTLGVMIQKQIDQKKLPPKKDEMDGPPGYRYNSPALEQNFTKNAPNVAVVLTKRKQLFLKGGSNDGQIQRIQKVNEAGGGYKVPPLGLNLATVEVGRLIKTGKGSMVANEGSRGAEPVTINGQTCPLAVWGFAPGGLYVSFLIFDSGCFGMAGLREFSATLH